MNIRLLWQSLDADSIINKAVRWQSLNVNMNFCKPAAVEITCYSSCDLTTAIVKQEQKIC